MATTNLRLMFGVEKLKKEFPGDLEFIDKKVSTYGDYDLREMLMEIREILQQRERLRRIGSGKRKGIGLRRGSLRR